MKRIEHCRHCDKEFVDYEAWLDRNRKSGRSFCCPECWDAFRRQVRVTVRCVVCLSPFEVTPSRVKRIVTCSPECRRERLSIAMERRISGQFAPMASTPSAIGGATSKGRMHTLGPGFRWGNPPDCRN